MYRLHIHAFLSATHTALIPLLRYVLNFPIRTITALILLVVGILFYYALPNPLFEDPTCTVLFARDGSLLAASIAEDGQYRFPETKEVPKKFAACAIAFEDRYFYWHPGINPLSLSKALLANLRARRVVRGGSTLTMQLARMLHPRAERNYKNKLIELVWALRLECAFSKHELLALYASHAPFGGNVVGLDAAAWRYYQTSANNLSWGQMAALAVLPNAPASIYPGKQHDAFRNKRDKLLHTLHAQGTIDAETLELALLEPLPAPPDLLPQHAWQLINHVFSNGRKGESIQTTLRFDLQCDVERLVTDYTAQHRTQLGRNIAALIADVETGEVLAYVGNTPGLNDRAQGFVNLITAKRSSGSILKPFLYAGMLEDGLLLPRQLIPDIPIKIGTFAPENASHQFQGAVRASNALAHSLNIPAVHMLRSYGIDVFLKLLKDLGATTFRQSADYYGLPLILGGGECSLWEMCGIYASLARTLNRFTTRGAYYTDNFHPLRYIHKEATEPNKEIQRDLLGAASIYLTFQALREVNRPEEESGWWNFASSRAIAWKTGTSWGGRDAWAIGVNKKYVVGIWNGNATGEGQSDLSGVRNAAPLMFQIWGILPNSEWFAPPYDDLRRIEVCAQSGLPPSANCRDLDSIFIPNREYEYSPCPYHQLIHLDSSEQYRVNASCYPLAKIHHRSWFVLPPAMGWFYSKQNPTYLPLPPWLEGCESSNDTQTMQFIYPRNANTEISIPRDIDGKPSPVRFELAHTRPNATVYWHLDNEYIGRSLHLHHLALLPSEGEHTLTVVDEKGERNSIPFTVIYRAK